MISKSTLDILFWLCTGLFLIHQVVERVIGIMVPFIDSYLDPILLMPILLYLITLERSIVFDKKSYQLSVYLMFGYFVLISILSELILPKFNSKLTPDKYDVVCYAIGTFIYFATSIISRRNTY